MQVIGMMLAMGEKVEQIIQKFFQLKIIFKS